MSNEFYVWLVGAVIVFLLTFFNAYLQKDKLQDGLVLTVTIIIVFSILSGFLCFIKYVFQF